MAGSMAADDATLWKSWCFAFGTGFCQQFWRANIATRMFKTHMTCRYGLVVKPFQLIFYQPGGVLQKWRPVTIWAIFLYFCLKIQPCKWKSPPSKHRGDYGAPFGRSNTLGKCIRKMSSESMVGPMAADDAKLRKPWLFAFGTRFCQQSRCENIAMPF